MARRKPVPTDTLPEQVVEDSSALDDCLAHLAACPEIAFDTEFVGEDTYTPDLCLVQVATRERLYILDPFAVPMDGFWQLIADPSRVSVVHAGREEVRMCRAGVGRPPGNVFDVQIASALVGYSYPIGYANLVQDVLRVSLRKGETLTDWRRRPLTPAQITYAFDDVRYLLAVYDRLSAMLRQLSRPAWAAEEFATFVRKSTTDEPATERWRKLKGTGVLDRRGLATLREVYAWRDAVAARGNRPPRTVVRDDLLIEIARRGPTTVDAVASLRGVPRGETQAIIDAVQRAKALPASLYPELPERENDPPHVTLLAQMLGVVLSEWCGRNDLNPGLAATTSDLRTVVRSRQPGGSLPDPFPLAAGWRGKFVLPELLAFLSGERGLRVVDPTDRYPLRIDPLPPAG